MRLLDPERNAGIVLTESYAMHPAAAVSGWYFSHPDSSYFGVGAIDRDQVADYARRKRMSLADAERWLAPLIGAAFAGVVYRVVGGEEPAPVEVAGDAQKA